MYHNTLLHDTLFVVLTCYTLINHPALGIKSAVCQPSNQIQLEKFLILHMQLLFPTAILGSLPAAKFRCNIFFSLLSLFCLK